MYFLRALLIQATIVSATNLYVASSDGSLTTLSLTGINSSYSLSAASTTSECSGNPSWLTLDSGNRILYCFDRGATGAINGSLNSFEVGTLGNLTRVARVTAPLSGVYSSMFGTNSTVRGMVTVSYDDSAAAVFGLGEAGAITEAKEVIYPTIPNAGPVTLRQDSSHLHQVILDPKEQYLIMNDLGGDVVRVFSWDKDSLTALDEKLSLATDAGAGPRHGVFWTSPAGKLYYIFVGELSQNIYVYTASYLCLRQSGMSFQKVFEIPALGTDDAKPAQTAPASEIQVTPDNKFIIVSNRDISFANSTQHKTGPSDTISTFRIADNGTLSLVQLAPSGGYNPRAFSINQAGNLIAVGHLANHTVAIWNRDVTTGLIETSAPAALVKLTGPVIHVIWDEEEVGVEN